MTEEHAAAPRLRDGVRAALPLAPSPILFGLSYGVLADATGFGRVAAIVMSATTFAGASQFASISVLGRRRNGGRGGSRSHLPERAVRGHQPHRRVDLSGRTAPQADRVAVDRRRVMGAIRASGTLRVADSRRRGMLLYVLWVGSTALGTVIGGVLDDPNALGLDAAFAALFLALAMPYLRNRRAREAAALAAGITLVLIPFTPAGVPIIAASAACLLGLRR